MTFKKNSETSKDSNNNDVVNNNTRKADRPLSIKKNRERCAWIIGILITVLTVFWVEITILIPLNRTSGVEKFNGDLQELAENIYDFESTYDCDKGCNTDFNELYKIYIEDVRLTTDEERNKYCTDPARMTTDPNKMASYTVVVTRYALGIWHETYPVVGCGVGYENRAFN